MSRWILPCILLAISHSALALSLGHLSIGSGPGEPLVASAPLHFDAPGGLRISAAVIGPNPDGLLLHSRYDPSTGSVVITTDVPVTQPNLSLRIIVGQGSVQFSGNYSVDLRARSSADNLGDDYGLQPSHVFAGQMSSSSPDPSSMTIRHGFIGPLRRGDTLNGVARSLSVTLGSSTRRVAVALFQGNPSAFIHHDPRRPKPGARLRVPSIVDVSLVSSLDADRLSHYLSGDTKPPFTLAPAAAAVQEPRLELRMLHWIRRHQLLPAQLDAVFLLRAVCFLLLAMVLPAILISQNRIARHRIRLARLHGSATSPESGYKELLGASRAVPSRDALAIARLLDLLEQNPERKDIRLQLLRRLAGVGAPREFMLHARPLVGALSGRQHQTLLALADQAGVPRSDILSLSPSPPH